MRLPASLTLRDESWSVLTSVEMTVVICSTAFGWRVLKSTPNSEPLTHFKMARSISNATGSPGTKICSASATPTETVTFPVM